MPKTGRTYVVEVKQPYGWLRIISGWFYTKQRAAQAFQDELLFHATLGHEVRLRGLRANQR